jgi:catabolite regulation protein CreA
MWTAANAARTRTCAILPLPPRVIATMTTPAHAQGADDPELIFKKTTVWRMLSPDAKLATYALDDPLVEGVACHFTVPEIGGWKGWAGFAEERSEISLACRQVGPIRFTGTFEQGEDMYRQRRSMFFKKMQIVRGCDAAQRAGLSGVFRPHHRRLAAELDLDGADHAVGRRARPALRGVSRGVSLAPSFTRHVMPGLDPGIHEARLVLDSAVPG